MVDERGKAKCAVTVSAMSVLGAGYRVAAAGRPRVATPDSADTQPQTLKGAMGFNCLDGVDRTGGCKAAAVACPGADEIPVEANRCDKQGFDHSD